MKIKIIFICFLLANSFHCFTYDINNIMSEDFFGFTLNDNKEAIVIKMITMGIEIKVTEDEEYNSVDISPIDQVLSEGDNLDFSFGLFQNKIIDMRFFLKDAKILDKLLEISITPNITDSSDKLIYEWKIDKVTIKCTHLLLIDKVDYLFINNLIAEEYREFCSSKEDTNAFF